MSIQWTDLFILMTLLLIAAFALDDLVIDIFAGIKRSHPRPLTPALRAALNSTPEKRIAILIANWHEDQILEPMILGNLAQVDYKNYYFFLGVYPNDLATLAAAQRLSARSPNVFTVVNSELGPTSKGQMLNQCARAIFAKEQELGVPFDAFLMHDSEDVIHPLSLKLINYFLNGADFVQIPVFSFDIPKREWVGGVYIDEFAEHHTKEMILRSDLHQAVPSAGTGTALSRTLVHALLREQNGNLLKEDTLTEDYHLGNSAYLLGFRSLFLCYYSEGSSGERDFIATREYFPKGLRASIRQKTRWAIGICFQGSENLGWKGSWKHNYFLWRDRRGFWNTLLLLNCAILIAWYFWNNRQLFSSEMNAYSLPLSVLIGTNFLNLIWRVGRRIQSVLWVSPWPQALMVPVRWPVANFINFTSTLLAWKQFHIAKWRGEKPKWVKTRHELPINFGQASAHVQVSISQPKGELQP